MIPVGGFPNVKMGVGKYFLFPILVSFVGVFVAAAHQFVMYAPTSTAINSSNISDSQFLLSSELSADTRPGRGIL